MSSTRFPGKVLTSFAGRPLVDHLLDAVRATAPADAISVLTSVDPSDDVLASYLSSRGVDVFRGALDDVFGRFRAALGRRPCTRFVRLSADSPLMPPALVRSMIARADAARADIVTNVYPRTFPKGWSVEVVDASAFADVDRGQLSAADREHVTAFFYAHPERYSIVNVTSGDAALAGEALAVDTPDDLMRLERLLASGMLPAFTAA